MSEDHANIFVQSATGLALAATALAEAAQALSEAAAALSTLDQGTNSPSTCYHSLDSTAQTPETHEVITEKSQIQEVDDDGSSVGANTGNNAHPKDMVPEAPFEKDQPDPTTPLGDHASPLSDSTAQGESVGVQRKLHIDGLLGHGHFYLVLEEEFDVLPLISAYATAGERTICYLPTPGSLFPWESIISAIIPDRQVRSAIGFSGTNIIQLSEIIEQFNSSHNGSVLVLRPTFLPRIQSHKAHSMSNSLIFWGLPGSSFWPDITEAVQQSQHTLLILSQREFIDPTFQAFLTGPGSSFKAHPHHSELNSPDPGSLLANFRDDVRRVVSRVQHLQNIHTIYEELLVSPVNDTAHLGFAAQSSKERIEVVNRFMARVFLRGRTQDGSPTIPCNGQALPISDKAHRRLGTLFGKAQPGAGVKPKPTPATSQTHAPPPNKINTPLTFSHRPGRWRITLQRDADAIPLIYYLAHQHPKSLCCISHSSSALPYGDLFRTISSYEVTATAKNQRSIDKALDHFSSPLVHSGLCLVRGNPLKAVENPSNFRHVCAEALIYWGLPAENSFLWPAQVSEYQFPHVYLIIPPDQLSTSRNPVLTGSDFQEHPDSAILLAEGNNSPLHLFREKARPAMGDLARGVLKQVALFYSPAYPPAYPASDFIRYVVMRSDYL